MIKLENVSKIYQPSKSVRVVALDNICLKIEQREFVALLGASGSGKSTLLYIIGLLERPTKGNVYINNKNTAYLSDEQLSLLRSEHFGFVFQQFNLIPKLTVLENILLPTTYIKEGTTKIHTDRAHSFLKSFGILDKRHALPNQLSGGQQQRVAIARALINSPDVIIADEPTGNLDSKTGQQIISLISNIHKTKNKTIILVTHDNKIASFAKRIIRIHDGVIKL